MEHFAQLLLQGYNQADAYKLAYPAQARQRPGTLYPNASRLAADSKVKARLAELRAAVAAPAILDAIQRQEFWSHIICDDSKDTRDRLRASELLGKAQGDFIERTESVNLNFHAIPPALGESAAIFAFSTVTLQRFDYTPQFGPPKCCPQRREYI